MKFGTILSTLAIVATAIAGNAQTHHSSRSMHQKMHQQQLAAASINKMDRSVVKDLIKDDVANRESKVVAGMSAETDRMLSDLLKEAHKHIGKPYRHGMKGPSAFDCSGFSSYVYKQFGYTISPASRAQYTEGTAIDRKQLRKGDLVFFTSRSSGRNVGHVGIVIDADNETGKFKFIHASIKGVRVNECEGYYEKRYVGARRIVADVAD